MVIHGIMCVMEKQYGFEASGQMLEGEEGVYSVVAAGVGSCPLACTEPRTAGAALTWGSLWGSCQPGGSADPSWGQGQDEKQHIKTQEGSILKNGQTMADCPLACPPTPVPTPAALGKNTNQI